MAEHIILENRSQLTVVTPMMKQYLDVKAEYEDHILMYRLGDFYECFFEDAVIASRELELTLTSRDCGDGKRAAMCGVPFHKSDVYVGRLVERGIKVAICEQVSDPKESQGLVKREVTRVVTPGTVTDASLLTDGKNNFLMAICLGSNGAGVAAADISTGEISATFLSGKDLLTLIRNEIGAYQPAEIIMNCKADELSGIAAFAKERFSSLVSDGVGRLFTYERSKELCRRHFGDDVSKLTETELLMASGALLSYIAETQKTDGAFARGVNVYTRRIRAHSPYPYTLNLSNCHGGYAYLPTKNDIPAGGYELWYFLNAIYTTYPLPKNTDDHWVMENLRLLRSGQK